MGATNFYMKAEGTDFEKVYDSLVSQAVCEYGEDNYNGTISTTTGAVELTLPPRYKNDPDGYVNELILNRNNHGIGKWGNAGFLIIEESDILIDVPYATTETRIPLNGTRKWKTVYKVMKWEGNNLVEAARFDKQIAAEKKAKEITIKTNDITMVKIGKELTNAEEQIVRFYPKQKKQKVKNGMKKWIVFGLAAE